MAYFEPFVKSRKIPLGRVRAGLTHDETGTEPVAKPFRFRAYPVSVSVYVPVSKRIVVQFRYGYLPIVSIRNGAVRSVDGAQYCTAGFAMLRTALALHVASLVVASAFS